MTDPHPSPLRLLVGWAAIIAPALHTATDAMEWLHGGFSSTQLWLNYLAFLAMPWLLLAVHAVWSGAFGALGLVGALLHGVAFTYFAHTTLYALELKVTDYASLWQRLGTTYTVHGALMIVGGLLFAWDGLRTRRMPPLALQLFGAGLLVNLAVGLLPAPDILQTLGTTVRNAGLVLLGWATLRHPQRPTP